MLIGIHPGRLEIFRHTFYNYECTLEAILYAHLGQSNVDDNLRSLEYTIKSVLIIHFPPPKTPIDLEQVRSDMNTVKQALARGCSRHQELLDIFLRSSDGHIARLSGHYLTTQHIRLHIAIEGSAQKSHTNVIAIQALRSATDIVHRDGSLLKETRSRLPRDRLTLGIRVCRMHWYLHWVQIKTEFYKPGSMNFAKVILEDGLFGELIAAMTQE